MEYKAETLYSKLVNITRVKMLKIFQILSVLILFLVGDSHAKELPTSLDWNEKYSIQVELKPSEFAPFLQSITVKVTEKTTGTNVYQFQEIGIPLEWVVKEIGSHKVLFVLIHSGGESGGSTLFRYLTVQKGQIQDNTLDDSPASFEFVDVNQDGKLEIVTKDLRFEWFEVEPPCHLIGFYAQNFDILQYFVPKIFTFQNTKFVENTFSFRQYLQNHYLSQVEKMLVTDNNDRNYLAGFIQYFYASTKLGKTNQAFAFIKKHNKPFQQYICQNGKTVNTTIFDFIQKYQEKILEVGNLEQ